MGASFTRSDNQTVVLFTKQDLEAFLDCTRKARTIPHARDFWLNFRNSVLRGLTVAEISGDVLDRQVPYSVHGGAPAGTWLGLTVKEIRDLNALSHRFMDDAVVNEDAWTKFKLVAHGAKIIPKGEVRRKATVRDMIQWEKYFGMN